MSSSRLDALFGPTLRRARPRARPTSTDRPGSRPVRPAAGRGTAPVYLAEAGSVQVRASTVALPMTRPSVKGLAPPPKAPFSAAAAPAVSFSVTPDRWMRCQSVGDLQVRQVEVEQVGAVARARGVPTLPERLGVASMSMKYRLRYTFVAPFVNTRPPEWRIWPVRSVALTTPNVIGKLIPALLA